MAFPPCADELLSLVDPAAGNDDISRAFNDYFVFSPHQTLGQITQDGKSTDIDEMIGGKLAPGLRACHERWISAFGTMMREGSSGWPSNCCICEPCVTLDGTRNQEGTNPVPPGENGVRRLFIGDALWLFYYDQMGINQILGAILDAYAVSGRLPIPNGSSSDSTVEDNMVAMILEIMVRQTKTGMSPGVRDRSTAYRTALGWNTKIGTALSVDSEVNSGFSTLFHRFIFNALEFFRDKRLAVAIRGDDSGRASVATMITLRNTLDVLKKRFEPFDYGRNYYNTLAGIVWTISALSVIKQLRSTLGIPTAFNEPFEFIPAAYDLLVLKKPVTRGDINRYSVHRECAVAGRHILLDLEVLDLNNTQEFETWLEDIEHNVEAYRTAYRNLSGVDLGASATPVIEHQVAVLA